MGAGAVSSKALGREVAREIHSAPGHSAIRNELAPLHRKGEPVIIAWKLIGILDCAQRLKHADERIEALSVQNFERDEGACHSIGYVRQWAKRRRLGASGFRPGIYTDDLPLVRFILRQLHPDPIPQS